MLVIEPISKQSTGFSSRVDYIILLFNVRNYFGRYFRSWTMVKGGYTDSAGLPISTIIARSSSLTGYLCYGFYKFLKKEFFNFIRRETTRACCSGYADSNGEFTHKQISFLMPELVKSFKECMGKDV